MIHLRVSRAFHTGVKSLLLHPMRSALTALSMLFGVGAVIAMLAVEHGFVPGSVNTQQLDPNIAINYQIENGSGEIKRVLSNSFGFGGSNCSLVLGRNA